jgi:hypothetical protein
LIGLADASPLRRSYFATSICASNLEQRDAKITGKYCKNRWCVVCNRIRTAKLRADYGPTIKGWEDPHFLTLSRPNVSGQQLHNEVRILLAALPKIARAVRRTDGLEVVAIRKLEITYNPKRRDFHPHIHLVVSNLWAAVALTNRWLEKFPTADRRGQDLQEANRETIAGELFKYFTKLIVKGLDKKQATPPPAALDTIFKAVRGLRTFQAMGFTLPVADVADEDLELNTSTESPVSPAGRSIIQWTWGTELTDWIDFETGELLTGYEPSAKMRALVNRILHPPPVVYLYPAVPPLTLSKRSRRAMWEVLPYTLRQEITALLAA